MYNNVPVYTESVVVKAKQPYNWYNLSVKQKYNGTISLNLCNSSALVQTEYFKRLLPHGILLDLVCDSHWKIFDKQHVVRYFVARNLQQSTRVFVLNVDVLTACNSTSLLHKKANENLSFDVHYVRTLTTT